jgi:hypothetical protein
MSRLEITASATATTILTCTRAKEEESARLPEAQKTLSLIIVKLLLDNLPQTLAGQKLVLAKCLEAMHQVAPFGVVYLFGSHARSEAHADSDVDLCIVSQAATRQLETAALWRRAMRPIWPRPSFTLVPITPDRLAEKTARHDHFFATVLKEGVVLAQD